MVKSTRMQAPNLCYHETQHTKSPWKKRISHVPIHLSGFHAVTNKVRQASVEYVKMCADNSWNSLNKLPTVDNWQIYPRTSPRLRRRGGMAVLAFGWDLNLLLPESPVCSNGGLRKRMAGLIMDGTILYQPLLVRAYFPGYSLPFVEQYWDVNNMWTCCSV